MCGLNNPQPYTAVLQRLSHHIYDPKLQPRYQHMYPHTLCRCGLYNPFLCRWARLLRLCNHDPAHLFPHRLCNRTLSRCHIPYNPYRAVYNGIVMSVIFAVGVNSAFFNCTFGCMTQSIYICINICIPANCACMGCIALLSAGRSSYYCIIIMT